MWYDKLNASHDVWSKKYTSDENSVEINFTEIIQTSQRLTYLPLARSRTSADKDANPGTIAVHV